MLEAPSAAGSTWVKPETIAKPKPGFLERRSSGTVVTLSPWEVLELAYLKPASCEVDLLLGQVPRLDLRASAQRRDGGSLSAGAARAAGKPLLAEDLRRVGEFGKL